MSGNGADLGAIYQAIVSLTERVGLLTEKVGVIETTMARKRDVDARFDELRQTLNGYHHAVIGHGMMLTDHEERIARLE